MTRRPPAKKKVHPLDLVSLGWIILVTFLVGLPVVLSDYGDQEELREGVFFLYLFLEFLPMLLYSLPVLLPDLSPHLFLPWLAVNTIISRNDFIGLIPQLRKLAQGIVVSEPRQVLPMEQSEI